MTAADLAAFFFAALVFASAEAAPLPGIVHGWNTSIGMAQERNAAAATFHVNVTDDPSLWLDNVMTPFIGKTMHMTDIKITKRNAFNSLIEFAVRTGNVLWTVSTGYPGVCGDWIEHINFAYTGVAKTAGFVTRNAWIENDNKIFRGLAVKDDWGFIDVTSATDTTVVMNYWSYQKAKFTMTWVLINDTTVVKKHGATEEK